MLFVSVEQTSAQINEQNKLIGKQITSGSGVNGPQLGSSFFFYQ